MVAVVSSRRSAPTELRVIDGGRASQRRRLSDDELIAAVRSGNADAADAVYDQLVGVVEGTLYRMLGARGDDHDDLVQSAFEQIVRTLRTGRFARACSLSAWAGLITSRIALNAIRDRRRRRRFIDASHTADEAAHGWHAPDDVHRVVAARSDLDRLRLHLGRMPRPKAMTLVLHDVLGNDITEVARLTGASVVAAQSRLARARRELRHRLDQDEGPVSEGGTTS
jgi:RNA polymerase sigma-70 factor (ECF subfamily)